MKYIIIRCDNSSNADIEGFIRTIEAGLLRKYNMNICNKKDLTMMMRWYNEKDKIKK